MSDIEKLLTGIEEKNRMLTQKNDEYGGLVEDYAQKKRAYRTALAGRIFELKSEGHPVTLIPTLARGNKVVADLKFSTEVAEGIMNACRMATNDLRTAIDSYRSILAWRKAEFEQTKRLHTP